MNQETIVMLIIALTIGAVIYNVVKSLTTKSKNSCGGCTGCDLSAHNKGCSHKTAHSRMAFDKMVPVRKE
ncbi:attachment p12 family protein [Breznakibacter xylanolyticus]|uniref:Attachment p12 family protein n=1 Tax=Breznakibacter xylanolyticus TaxID=990 RepID=A0A2W7N5V4_9BACT|nr:FeoB-associated Cys-rich membrane protein [Breznakibacter xylanolyticus]MBN2744344.1 FeoB-associated Cys-rich membrane protein [Marinilabiliaceae bacterium]PZX12224.1 attachment p12 family protein [Breznakibacter xylanolyticus]